MNQHTARRMWGFMWLLVAWAWVHFANEPFVLLVGGYALGALFLELKEELP